MGLFSDYSNYVVNSFLKLKEGDALSINTEESDFEFAKVIADNAVRVTKTVVKIVVTENGRPTEVVDFDPYDNPVQAISYCMLHLKHEDSSSLVDQNTLDVIVEKDDMKSIQKLGHLADPIILDRKIAIPWCVIPSFNVNDEGLVTLLNRLSIDFDGQVLSTKYRIKFLNHADIDKLHFHGDKCDFTVEIPKNSQFIGGSCLLKNGREFVSGVDFQNISINVDKNSINGWFEATTTIFGKKTSIKLEFKEGRLVNISDSRRLEKLIAFDFQLSKPGYVSLNDKDFEIVFGGASIDSMTVHPENVEDLPDWFNDSLYKFTCKLNDKLNIDYIDCKNVSHELVRKGFFLE